jgi:hypothetical protein
MNEPVRASAVWREALAIVVRHPVATVAPALFLGPLTETPHLLPDHRFSLERVMNLGENRIGMRITRSAWFLRDLRFPHS